MALATMFVTLPFVVRELIPILETMDLSEVSPASWFTLMVKVAQLYGQQPIHTSLSYNC